MIISISEFKELGFSVDSQNEKLLESCIKRAEHILNALCGGMIASAMAQSKSGASLIKQAAAFEADALIKAELKEKQAEQMSANESVSTHVSIGDLSYTESSKKSSGSASSPFDVPKTVERLLRAAGCVLCTAAEVIE